MASRSGLHPLCSPVFVIPVFIGHIPIGQNDDTRRKRFPLSSLFRVADFEIDVIPVFQLLIKGALKSVCPLGVVLNDLFKAVEEPSVGIYTRNFNIGAGVLNKVTLKKRNGLQSLKANKKPIERLVDFNNLLKEG
jgi:hypothetical protein